MTKIELDIDVRRVLDDVGRKLVTFVSARTSIHSAMLAQHQLPVSTSSYSHNSRNQRILGGPLTTISRINPVSYKRMASERLNARVAKGNSRATATDPLLQI